tara:strand:- start:474 stop:1307 length:834 start_codon:yes stop_codon:yes gene_type:complete
MNIYAHIIDSDFTPQSIINDFKDIVPIEYNIQVTNNVSLKIFNDNKVKKEFTDKLVRRILIFAKKDPDRKVEVIVYLNKQKKKLNHEIDTIGTDQVNSGVCFFQQQLSRVVIFRREDIMKTLIHELIHAYNLDCKHREESFDFLEKKVLVNEAYVEFNARVSEAVVYADENELDLIELLDQQVNHAVKVARRVIGFFGYTSLESLINSSDFKFKETSNVFAYYVLTAALLVDIPKYSTMVCEDIDFNEALVKLVNTGLFNKIQINNTKCVSLKMSVF